MVIIHYITENILFGKKRALDLLHMSTLLKILQKAPWLLKVFPFVLGILEIILLKVLVFYGQNKMLQIPILLVYLVKSLSKENSLVFW